MQLPQKTISRMAPTPSGLLHLGNALNLILTWAMVRKEQGQLHLRIDDLDAERSRPEFIDDIFWALEWLGLDYDKGPKNADDFYLNYSQQKKTNYYRSKMQKLKNVYPCECSRKDIQENSSRGSYTGTCRSKKLKYDPALHNLRIHINTENPHHIHEDFVVWRKNDLPSYQLMSVIEDHAIGTNLLVRGEDLIDSSAMQRFLASQLKLPTFYNARFIHHKMMTTRDGKKLSKSDDALSLKFMSEQGALARDIFKEIGIALDMENAHELANAQDFLAAYQMRELQ